MTQNPRNDDPPPGPSHLDSRPVECARPISLGPCIARRSAPTPPAVTDHLRTSLRASEVYIRILLDQAELAATTGSGALDRIPTTVLRELAAISDTLHDGVHRTLHHLDRDVARNARAAAELAVDHDPSW